MVVETKRKRVMVPKPGDNSAAARNAEGGAGKSVTDAEMDRRLKALQAAKAQEAEDAAKREAAEKEREVERERRRAEAEAKEREEKEREEALKAKAEEEERKTREAEVAKIMAAKDSETQRLLATVSAEAERLRNEAENLLSEDARAGRLRVQLIERLEAIVRETVKPMEKIDSIKVVHLGGAGIGEGGGARSPTDEVMDSVLRYRVQAPMIEELLKDVGVDGANLTRSGDIFRSAKDAKSLMPDPGKSGPEKKDG